MDDYPEGWDVTWGAVDRDGRVALFTTDAEGPIPTILLQGGSLLDVKIQEAIDDLPCTSAVFSHRDPEGFDWHVAVVERGIFTYWWRDAYSAAVTTLKTNCYEPLLSPMTPILVTDLPTAFAAWVSRVRLDDVLFIDHTPIDVRAMLSCVESEHR